jgi:ATP-dependent DNA helicase RecG
LFYPENEYLPLIGQYFPIYPTTAGLSNKSIRKAMKQALSITVDEFLPVGVLEQYHLFPLQEALELLHFPKNFDDIWEARQRLVFDEFLLFIIKIRTLKEKVLKKQSKIKLLPVAHCQRLMEALPFSLTKSQYSCFLDIEHDMESGYVMNRLIQGDVGSGKTIIAILALLKVVANGYQTAFMAPTEVLASQHYETILSMTRKYQLPFRPVLLTGSITSKNKVEIYKNIEQGKYNLIIGTHALIQEKVCYQSLGLVICDEQHRFGVRQRDSFSDKGDNVHVLVMSATPIPRTLAIILYGDLHVSIINEMPANRLPIKNCVVGTDYRNKAYSFITEQIKEGHQVYIICPMVEEGELDGVENVTDYTLKIKVSFRNSFV